MHDVTLILREDRLRRKKYGVSSSSMGIDTPSNHVKFYCLLCMIACVCVALCRSLGLLFCPQELVLMGSLGVVISNLIHQPNPVT